MRLSEIGLLLLATAAIAGLFIVVTGQTPVVIQQEDDPLPTDPLELLEMDLAPVMYGPGFRDVPSAPPDTMVKSMDLVEGVSLQQANLLITRTLAEHGFTHHVTYIIPGRGLSFICSTPEGEPLRLELTNTRL
jgi:hypothetical protein